MGGKAKISLIIAAALVLFGIAGLLITGASIDWKFDKLSTEDYVTNSYDITEEFTDISIKTDTADVIFAPSNDENCKIICYEKSKVKHTVSVLNNTLTVEAVATREWYEYIDISFESAKITVYLPEKEYSSLVIDESTGDIEIPNKFKFEKVNISVSTGDVRYYASASKDVNITSSTGDVYIKKVSAASLGISVSTGKITVTDTNIIGNVTVGVSTGGVYLTDVSCKNLISTGSTSDISLKRVIASKRFSIERSSGDVLFEESDAAEIFIETSTGDVKGSLLSSKIFITETDTGDVKVPSSSSGGTCEIETDTGDIEIFIEN